MRGRAVDEKKILHSKPTCTHIKRTHPLLANPLVYRAPYRNTHPGHSKNTRRGTPTSTPTITHPPPSSAPPTVAVSPTRLPSLPHRPTPRPSHALTHPRTPPRTHARSLACPSRTVWSVLSARRMLPRAVSSTDCCSDSCREGARRRREAERRKGGKERVEGAGRGGGGDGREHSG